LFTILRGRRGGVATLSHKLQAKLALAGIAAASSKSLMKQAQHVDHITTAMLLPRILAPVRASLSASAKTIAPSKSVLEALRAANGSTAPSATVTLPFVRYASHQSQGRANGAKDGPGKRLGAKKSGGTYMPHATYHTRSAA
jgi:hypothetical protein